MRRALLFIAMLLVPIVLWALRWPARRPRPCPASRLPGPQERASQCPAYGSTACTPSTVIPRAESSTGICR